MKITSNFNMSKKERDAYIAVLKEKEGSLDNITSVKLSLNGDDVDIDYDVKTPKFERIRRITGYLVGTMDRWNNAKKSELSQRVSHKFGCSCCK